MIKTNTTGERIRELRIKNHLTLDDVAKYLGVGRQAIYKYEQGTVTNIPLENLEKMATLFGTTPGYLAGWSETPPDDPIHGKKLSSDARILAQGFDKLPKEQQERALAMFRVMFEPQYAHLFTKGPEDDDT